MIETNKIDDSIKYLTSNYLILDTLLLYFILLELPSYFGYGYNSFVFSINSKYFRANTNIVVKIFDKFNKLIKSLISKYTLKLNIRVYFNIDSSMLIGFANICIVGCLLSTNSNIQIPLLHENIYNVRFLKKIYINNSVYTPSELRFDISPKINLLIQTKSLYTGLVVVVLLLIPITSININDQYKSYFLLIVDTNSATSSLFAPVYYLKYLNYPTITNSFSTLTNKQIYSGSFYTSSLSGSSQGRVYSSQSFTASGQYIVYKGEVLLNNDVISSNQYCNLLGWDSTIDIDYTTFTGYRTDIVNTILYIKDASPKIASIVPGSWNIKFDKMYTTASILSGSLNTSYVIGTYSGTTVSTEYANITNVVSATYAIYLNYVKDPKTIFLPLSVKEYNYPIIINGKFDGLLIGSVLLKNTLPVTVKYISLYTNTIYNTIYASVYNVFLISQLIYLDPDSQFIGTVSGIGTAVGDYSSPTDFGILLTSASGTTSSIRIYDGESIGLSGSGYTYYGSFRTAKIKTIYVNGLLTTGSLSYKHTNLVLIPSQYTDFTNYLDFQLTILSGAFYCSYCSYYRVSFLKNKYMPQISSRATSSYSGLTRLNNNSKIYIDSTLPIKLTPDTIIDVLGCVNLNNFTGTGSGYFQLTNDVILKYSIYNTLLTGYTNTVFNNKSVYIFDNSYDKIYIPIAIKYENVEKLYTSLTSSNGKSCIGLQFGFYNDFYNKVKLDVLNFNLFLYIDDIIPYSGYVNQVLIQYKDTLNDTYQYLNTILIPYTDVNSITTSIDLPYNLFKNQSLDFQFKFKDGNNKYTIKDYDVFIPNIKLLNYVSILDIQSFNNNVSSGDLVTSVNGMVGDVVLDSADIGYGLYSYTTVYDALNALLYTPFTWTMASATTRATGSNTSAAWTFTSNRGTINPVSFSVTVSAGPMRTDSGANTSVFPTTVYQSTMSLSDRSYTYTGSATTHSLKIVINSVDLRAAAATQTAYRYIQNYYYVGFTSDVSAILSDLQQFTQSGVTGNWLYKADAGALAISRAKTIANTGTSGYLIIAYPTRFSATLPSLTIGGFGTDWNTSTYSGTINRTEGTYISSLNYKMCWTTNATSDLSCVIGA